MVDTENTDSYPHPGCGGWWSECPYCVHGWICSGCHKHDNENDLDPECKKDKRP